MAPNKPSPNLDIRFDPLDTDQERLLLSLSPGERIRAMLDAQALAKGLIMGRLHRQHPDLSPVHHSSLILHHIRPCPTPTPKPSP